MTKYDLRQWKNKDEMTAALNIAEAKFATWRTRILFAVANADAEDAVRAPKELLVEMITDSVRLWISGFKDSLRECADLYNIVWSLMCGMFHSVARTEILERDGFMAAFVSVAEELTRSLLADSEKESTE